MTFIQLKNTIIYFEQTGSGPPLLFLHGLGSCGSDWMLQIPYFATRYTVITPDLRGHGRSDKEADLYKISNLAEDVLLLLDALQIEKVAIVGLSLGSFVALQLALTQPDRVKSLTLAGTTSRARDIGRLSLVIRQLLIAICPMWLIAKIVARFCFPRKNQSRWRKKCEMRLKANNKTCYRKIFNALRWFDIQSRLQELKCPIQLICGQNDQIVPLIHAKKIQKSCPHASLSIIEGAHHVTPIECPQAFNELVDTFLKQNFEI